MAIMKWLRRQRMRELRDDGPLWHGISIIRQASGQPKTKAAKVEVRAALDRLIEGGKVERLVCSNGVYYRSVGPDYILV